VDAIVAKQKAAGTYKTMGVPTPANRPDRCGSAGVWQQEAAELCMGHSSCLSAELHAIGPQGLQPQAPQFTTVPQQARLDSIELLALLLDANDYDSSSTSCTWLADLAGCLPARPDWPACLLAGWWKAS
jgi:hypothetical protein